MITKYSALPFTKKFQLKQASPRPPGHFQICFAYESLPNLNIKHHLVFGNTFTFLNICFWRFHNPCTAYDSFFLLCSWCWNVVRWEGWERQKHTTEQADVSLHYCIQEWELGEGGGRGVRTKKTQRRYVQPPLWTGNRAAAIWWPVMPPNATYFSCVFFFPLFL